ncbi:hypothetical protein Taro_004598 [Colocasia esculenta]|uniref:Uncharacterized protein n=1 Tax=Colocasia esculenta TaxID=4460 RepID=A0A843TQF8_COLES|nr:hypothetical protein [Colocasia esculenta]
MVCSLCLHGLWFGIPCEASACSREADSDQVRYRINGLGRGIPPQLVSEQEISGMADRRDWGGGGDDPEESTQRMIERIWESLTDIRARMDQQAPVPPVAVPPRDGEAVPVAPVPPGVEVPFAAPVPPPPPVLIAEEPVMQVIGSPEGRFSALFSLPLAPASRPCIPKASNKYRRVVGGSWDVWRCQIGRGDAVAWCNYRGSSRRVRCEPGEFGRFKRVLSCTSGYAPGSCTLFQFGGNMAM